MYGGWWLEPSSKTPAHGPRTTPWVAFSRLASPPPAEMVGENARRRTAARVFASRAKKKKKREGGTWVGG
ncbi:hypothetical protein Tco_0421358 [Tanacetum coccineum]